MGDTLPYLNASGTITRCLEKIKSAATPDRFTQDFLAVKLGLPGGSAKPIIPFLKRIGFLGSDGIPTPLYKLFRNPSESGKAAAEALRLGYKPLYEMNEFVHDLPEKDVKGLVVQLTGQEASSSTVKGMLGSFRALKAFAMFDGRVDGAVKTDNDVEASPDEPGAVGPGEPTPLKLGIGYTINLNLPATSDIAVFNAIFKSLREHLLR